MTEVEVLRQAVGLAATTVPKLVINVDDPIGMMQGVVDEVARLRDSEELAWTIIANANEGDWAKAGKEWREAAERWRDEYHKYLPPPTGDKVEEPLGPEEKL